MSARARTWPVRIAGGVLLLAALTPALPAQDAPEDVRGPRIFRLPETRDASTLAGRAHDHARGERWSQAIEDLQELLEKHPGDVLPASWRDAREGISLYAAHPGAAEWALRELFALPEEARALYRNRYGAQAAAALQRARASTDRRALVDVAQRWPITDAAQSAWWALGDLELELGHLSDAAHAWERAVELLQLDGRPLPPGATQRLELADRIGRGESSLGAAGPEAGRAPAELRLPGTLEGGGPPPMEAASTWDQELGPHPFDDRGRVDQFNLFPVLAGERVLVSTSLRLEAFDAFTGESLWRTPEPEGWNLLPEESARTSLYSGIDRTWCLVAPAAGEGIAVASLQIPYTKDSAKDYQGITIKVPLPERRLFAFDLATGDPLWNHAPPSGWDGSSGSFAQRTLVAGPPVVTGTRVLVPCYRIQGRIEYHVACYDLTSGELLWATELISGQRELNMFGRHEREFCAPPLRVEGDRVVALTQLGLLAAVDLFSGRILWESLYDQIPLPSARGYSARRRRPVWRNAPPVVAGGVVVATPTDSPDMVGIDLEHGTVLWSVSRDSLEPLHARPLGINALIGADDDTVYLGGGAIVAWTKPGGLGLRRPDGSSAPFERRWFQEIENGTRDINFRPRPILGRDTVIVPDHGTRTVLDRQSGALLRKLSWPSSQLGNLLLGEGMLFSLGGRRITGYFDWDVLERRALQALEEQPDSPDAALPLAALLYRRGAAVHEQGSTTQALELLRRARQVLEPLIARADDGGGRGNGEGDALADGPTDPRVTELLHHVLRGEARALADLADTDGALELIERARALAPDLTALRDTLLQRELLVRDRSPELWVETLGELESACGELAVPPDHLASLPDARDLFAPGGADSADAPPLPVGLWVLLERSQHWSRRGLPELELDDLHACLARYGERRLPSGTPVRELAEERIARCIQLHGRAAYAPFEERASALLARALEAHTADLLERVVRLYPHAAAARAARDTRLAWAFEAGDAPTVARLVRDSRSDEPEPTADDTDLLLVLGEALARQGSVQFQHTLLRTLARLHPGHRDREGHSLSELVDALPSGGERKLPAERNRFDESARMTFGTDLEVELLGELPAGPPVAEETPDTVLVFWTERGVMAFSADDPSQPLWESETQIPDHWLGLSELFPGRVLLLTRGNQQLVCLDGLTGRTAWTHDVTPPDAEDILYVAGSDAVAVAVSRVEEGDDALFRATALDAWTGIELWSLDLPRGPAWLWPICGESKVVFLPRMSARPSPGLVVDLFRGVTVAELDPGERVNTTTHRTAWIEDDVLVLPTFHGSQRPERNHVLGFDLRTGRRAWSLDFEGASELYGIAQCGAETYLVVVERDAGGELLQLMPASGARRRILDLEPGEELIGVSRSERIRLPGPFLFARTRAPGSSTTPITAVHLPYGKRWVRQLPVAYEDLYDSGMPLPALSDSTVVLAYATSGGGARIEDRHLVFLERGTGRLLDTRILPYALSRTDELQVVGVGDALILYGGRRGSARLEVWESRR